ncbi:hypothetical protein IQ270_00360 [Microcoleus sp. LEGE 07076]|uniref:hypothetical protein n=1 Tax=Microcoleus sp. LEGE 07076 TaxID=915322 RepID=UPI0018831174|nr:hypothetical protein [Microcoleus sp. LEGE 07076]MBE9183214.1 hypothetical protein [Microcoleus sp. LEGE 07076]
MCRTFNTPCLIALAIRGAPDRSYPGSGIAPPKPCQQPGQTQLQIAIALRSPALEGGTGNGCFVPATIPGMPGEF